MSLKTAVLQLAQKLKAAVGVERAVMVSVGLISVSAVASAQPLPTPPTCKQQIFPSGETIITQDTGISCDSILFEDGARVLVTGGHTLRLKAKTFEVRGRAEIVANGRRGDDGRQPERLKDEAPWRSQGLQDFERAIKDCQAESHKDHGRPGGASGSGEPGGHVVLSSTAKPLVQTGRLVISANGGAPGTPAKGGSGRLYIRGDNPTADGAQRHCPSGRDGASGLPGAAGSVTLE